MSKKRLAPFLHIPRTFQTSPIKNDNQFHFWLVDAILGRYPSIQVYEAAFVVETIIICLAASISASAFAHDAETGLDTRELQSLVTALLGGAEIKSQPGHRSDGEPEVYIELGTDANGQNILYSINRDHYHQVLSAVIQMYRSDLKLRCPDCEIPEIRENFSRKSSVFLGRIQAWASLKRHEFGIKAAAGFIAYKAIVETIETLVIPVHGFCTFFDMAYVPLALGAQRLNDFANSSLAEESYSNRLRAFYKTLVNFYRVKLALKNVLRAGTGETKGWWLPLPTAEEWAEHLHKQYPEEHDLHAVGELAKYLASSPQRGAFYVDPELRSPHVGLLGEMISGGRDSLESIFNPALTSEERFYNALSEREYLLMTRRALIDLSLSLYKNKQIPKELYSAASKVHGKLFRLTRRYSNFLFVALFYPNTPQAGMIRANSAEVRKQLLSVMQVSNEGLNTDKFRSALATFDRAEAAIEEIFKNINALRRNESTHPRLPTRVKNVAVRCWQAIST